MEIPKLIDGFCMVPKTKEEGVSGDQHRDGSSQRSRLS